MGENLSRVKGSPTCIIQSNHKESGVIHYPHESIVNPKEWGILLAFRECCHPSHTELVKVIVTVYNCYGIQQYTVYSIQQYTTFSSCLIMRHGVLLLSLWNKKQEDGLNQLWCNFSEVYL